MKSYSHVVVTGANGWLGKSIVQNLVNGLTDRKDLPTLSSGKIRCFVLPGEDTSFLRSFGERIEISEGNVCNSKDVARLTRGMSGGLMIHTAAVIHPRRVSDFKSVNVMGTHTVLSSALVAGIERAVVVSSNSPCGNNPHVDHRFDEESAYHPYMGYGKSKMQMEQMIKKEFYNSTLETTLIRAPWFYGTNQPPRQTLFFSMIKNGKGPIVGNGMNLRSMAYVENLCQGIFLAALTASANRKTYWIADENPYSMLKIMDTIERLLETEFKIPVKHKRMKLPALAAEVATLVDASLQAVGIYHQKIHVLSEMNKTIACSVEKAKIELGYQPRVALEEGMRRSIQWCLDQGQTI